MDWVGRYELASGHRAIDPNTNKLQGIRYAKKKIRDSGVEIKLHMASDRGMVIVI
jgi:hypothetical protein